jgi:hypothetical protein
MPIGANLNTISGNNNPSAAILGYTAGTITDSNNYLTTATDLFNYVPSGSSYLPATSTVNSI